MVTRLERPTTAGEKQPGPGWNRGLDIPIARGQSTDRSQLATDAYRHTSRLQYFSARELVEMG